MAMRRPGGYPRGVYGDIYNRLRGYYLTWFGSDPLPERGILELAGDVTVADDPTNKRTVATFAAGTTSTLAALAGQTPSLGGLTLTSGSTTVEQVVTGALTTTNGSTVTLATIPIPAGSGVYVDYTVTAKILPSSTEIVASAWHRAAIGGRPTSGSPTGTDLGGLDVQTVLVPFWDPAAHSETYRPGGPSLGSSGNNLLLQVQGLAAPTAWQASHAYTEGLLVTNGGKVYVCITPGTSAGSGGPSGTASDITDGTAHWAWVSSTPSEWTTVTIAWTLVAVVRLF